jgi:transcriptional regulator of acetoin/glycerol metabolism
VWRCSALEHGPSTLASSEESASKWEIAIGVGSHPSREGSESQPSRDPIEIDLGAIPGAITATIRDRRKAIWHNVRKSVFIQVESDGSIAELQRKEQPTFQQIRCSPDSEEAIVRSYAFQSVLHLVGLIARRGSINCAAIPAMLLASQLFASERGAFTGYVFVNQRPIRN